MIANTLISSKQGKGTQNNVNTTESQGFPEHKNTFTAISGFRYGTVEVGEAQKWAKHMKAPINESEKPKKQHIKPN